MKYVFWIAIAVALIAAGYRIIEPNVANAVLQDDVRDAAAQLGWRTGMTTVHSDDELRHIIVGKAQRDGIVLDPKQITIRNSGTEQNPLWFIAVDYRVKVDLLLYSFSLRFKPSSQGDSPFWGRLDSELPQSPAQESPPPASTPKPVPSKPSQGQESQQAPELKKIPESLKQPMSH